MENPSDLIVAVTSDDPYHDKKKTFMENIRQGQDEFLPDLPSDKHPLEQSRVQQAVHDGDDEFNEQSSLLKQRFDDEVQSILLHQTELVQHAANHLTQHVTDVLQASILDIESLRLLHHKELCTYSNTITDCIRHQSCEMSQLCHHLINQQRANRMNLFIQLIENFEVAVTDLARSFDSKVNYLNELHSSTIDKLSNKHETEMNKLKCELNLLSLRPT